MMVYEKMKSVLFLPVLLFLLSCDLVAQDDLRIKWDQRELSFDDFVTTTEKLYNLRFFYKDEWVKELKFEIPEGIYSATELLDKLLKGTSLFYFIDADRN